MWVSIREMEIRVQSRGEESLFRRWRGEEDEYWWKGGYWVYWEYGGHLRV